MTNTVLSYPIPAFANVPISPESYQPSQFVITDIAFGQTTVVTMANGTNNVSPNYVIGQLVRLVIPEKYGSIQLNEQSGFVLSVPTSNSVEIDIVSVGTTPFISSPTFLPMQSQTPPQIVAVGDQSSGAINASGRSSQGTFIPGSFINVSP